MAVSKEFDTGSGPRNLANAIIYKAVEDWRGAVKKLAKNPSETVQKRLEDEKASCERFFLSAWFEELAPGEMDGKTLLAMLKRESEGGDPYER